MCSETIEKHILYIYELSRVGINIYSETAGLFLINNKI